MYTLIHVDTVFFMDIHVHVYLHDLRYLRVLFLPGSSNQRFKKSDYCIASSICGTIIKKIYYIYLGYVHIVSRGRLHH